MRIFSYRTGRAEQPSPTGECKFNVGDVVVLTITIPAPNGGNYAKIKKGSRGYVTRIASTGRIGVSFYNYTGGHDCNQSAVDGSGLYIQSRFLTIVDKTIEDDFAELARMCE